MADGSGETIAYASARAIGIDLLAGLLPPERLDVASWAVRKRWMANAGGGHVGRWSHDEVPYTVEPSRCLTSLDYLTVAVVGPGQVAKTVIAENWLGYSVDVDPASFLWYMQSDDGVESYVKGRINPFIDDHDILRRKRGTRPVDDSLHFKRFQGMTVEFLTFGDRTVINKSAPRIVADEIDNYQWLGDVHPVLSIRRQTFGRQSMLLATSHPDLAKGMDPARHWGAGIMAIYGGSDRRAWWWACPHCGATSSPVPTASRYMAIEYPRGDDVPLEVIEAEAHLLCPVNGCVIEDHERKAMNRTAFERWGGWVGAGQALSEGGELTGELIRSDVAGFWIVGAMSPFILGGIGALAKERVKAEREREASGEDATLRQVMVKRWGVPYVPSRGVGSIDAETLVERADPALPLARIPEAARFVTLGVDVQKGYFEYLYRWWGVGAESGVLLHGRVLADPATNPADWDKLLGLYDRRFPLADGSARSMGVRAFGYDSGGEAGVTAQAYGFWSRARKARRVRRMGVIAGRDVYNIIPTKGAKALEARKLTVVYPDTARASNRAAARGHVPLASFNPNLFKEDLAGQLMCAEPGAGYVHFPAALKAAQPPHPFFEQLVAERRLDNGRWEKTTPTARNEVLDLMVLTHVVAHLHGLSRIDWTLPPNWAAPWDTNSMVTAAQAEAVSTTAKVEPSEGAPAGPPIPAGATADVPPVIPAEAPAEPAPPTAPAKAAPAPKKKSLASRMV